MITPIRIPNGISWESVYYLNDRSGECDFVVCKGNKVEQYIQVSCDISI